MLTPGAASPLRSRTARPRGHIYRVRSAGASRVVLRRTLPPCRAVGVHGRTVRAARPAQYFFFLQALLFFLDGEELKPAPHPCTRSGLAALYAAAPSRRHGSCFSGTAHALQVPRLRTLRAAHYRPVSTLRVQSCFSCRCAGSCSPALRSRRSRARHAVCLPGTQMKCAGNTEKEKENRPVPAPALASLRQCAGNYRSVCAPRAGIDPAPAHCIFPHRWPPQIQ